VEKYGVCNYELAGCQFAHIEPTSQPATERVKCRFFGTFRGCKNGDGCQFKHD